MLEGHVVMSGGVGGAFLLSFLFVVDVPPTTDLIATTATTSRDDRLRMAVFGMNIFFSSFLCENIFLWERNAIFFSTR